jgi:hypothetical protein
MRCYREKARGYEEHVARGVFTKADVNNDAWTFRTNEGSVHRGFVAKDSDVTLSGVQVDTKTYQIVCRELLAEAVGSGKQTSPLLITSLEPVA